MTNASTLHLLHYNNYYNRLVKKEDTLEAYLQYRIGNAISGINFIPNDFVNTTQIVNWDKENPDYLIVTDENNNIKSRWFIVSTKRLRANQLQLDLHRDLIVDFYDSILNSDCFIEKATLEDSSPFIYNSEDMTFNQIKSGEQELKDETGCAWIVGYMTSKTETEDGEDLDISADFDAAVGADEAVAGIANWKYYKYSNLAGNAKEDLAGFPSKIAYCIYGRTNATLPEVYKVCFNKSGGQPLGLVQVTVTGDKREYTGYGHTSYSYASDWNPVCKHTGLSLNWTSDFTDISKWNTAFNPYYNTLSSQAINYLPVQSEDDTIELNDYNGKIIYDSQTKKYYQISITKKAAAWSETPIVSGAMYNTFLSAYNTRVASYNNSHSNTWENYIANGTEPNENTFAIRTYGYKYEVNLTILDGYGGTGYKIKLGKDRYHLNDAPYDMFCIPYSDDLDIYKNGVKLFTANKLLAFQTVMALVRKYQAAGYIYDVQLLPFCPVRNMIKPGNIFDVGDNYVDYITYVGSSTLRENIGLIAYASKSSDTFNIEIPITYTNKKIAAMCDMYRLCSPNYNGQFEFNAAVNEGVEFFNVDFTYKPFNPYIHINPNFKNLYGQDWNDSRGLVCGGEFSLPAVSSQWDTYELQNKNYQNIFDRQVQNMEVNNSVQRTREMWGIATGTISGSVSGATAGAMAGGPWGALAGGIAGGTTSLIGGIADYSLNEKLRNETLDYTKDMYGYNLQNIQALPYTLTRTTAFTYNNKIFPILEYYTCTQEEKDALANKIAYNGMTVMAIGKLKNYIGNSWSYNGIESNGYVKCKLIRFNEIGEDYHIATALAEELNKGVFI